jgi:hypothetical protein
MQSTSSLQTVTTPVKTDALRIDKRKEQSLEYVLRSGLAGGIAGCVVIIVITKRKDPVD